MDVKVQDGREAEVATLGRDLRLNRKAVSRHTRRGLLGGLLHTLDIILLGVAEAFLDSPSLRLCKGIPGQASVAHLARDSCPHIIQQIKEVSAMLNCCKGVGAFPVWAPRKMTVYMDRARCESSLRAPKLASLEVRCFDGVLPDLNLLPGSLTFLHLRDIRTTKGALSFTKGKLGEPKCHGTMQVDVKTNRERHVCTDEKQNPSAGMPQGGGGVTRACPSLPLELWENVLRHVDTAADKARLCAAVRCLGNKVTHMTEYAQGCEKTALYAAHWHDFKGNYRWDCAHLKDIRMSSNPESQATSCRHHDTLFFDDMTDLEARSLASCLNLTPAAVREHNSRLREMEDTLLDCLRPGLRQLQSEWQQRDPDSLEASSVHFIASSIRLAIRDFPIRGQALGDYIARIDRLAPGLRQPANTKQLVVADPIREAFPGRYYSMHAVWERVIEVSEVCGHEPIMVAGRLEARHFLAAVRECERDQRKRGALEGTLSYLERALADISRGAEENQGAERSHGQTCQEEEFITNKLMKHLEQLKKEKQVLATEVSLAPLHNHAAHLGQEEEHLINNLQKRLEQLNSEKLELEKRESEQEGIVSKLQKKLLEAEGFSMEKHKLNLEKVQLENQLEAKQEYIVHKLQKQVTRMGQEKMLLQKEKSGLQRAVTDLAAEVERINSEKMQLESQLEMEEEGIVNRMNRAMIWARIVICILLVGLCQASTLHTHIDNHCASWTIVATTSYAPGTSKFINRQIPPRGSAVDQYGPLTTPVTITVTVLDAPNNNHFNIAQDKSVIADDSPLDAYGVDFWLNDGNGSPVRALPKVLLLHPHLKCGP
eukprot:jgi/Astpho2/973/Aster-00804